MKIQLHFGIFYHPFNSAIYPQITYVMQIWIHKSVPRHLSPLYPTIPTMPFLFIVGRGSNAINILFFPHPLLRLSFFIILLPLLASGNPLHEQ